MIKRLYKACICKIEKTTVSFLLLRIYVIFFIHVCFVSKFQKYNRRTLSMSTQNYTECLQTKYDNQRDFNFKEISILTHSVRNLKKQNKMATWTEVEKWRKYSNIFSLVYIKNDVILSQSTTSTKAALTGFPSRSRK